jgi:hypothetical protein
LGYGFPYALYLQPIFQPVDLQSSLTSVCNTFFNFYNDQFDSDLRSATIGLYHTAHLTELAETLKPIFNAHRSELEKVEPSTLQRYANVNVFYDLDDYVGKIATPVEYNLFKTAFDKVVVHKRATDYFFTMLTHPDTFIPVLHWGGISTYVPVPSQTLLKTAYKETDWNRAVGLVE